MTDKEYQYLIKRIAILDNAMRLIEDHSCRGYILMEGAKSALEDILKNYLEGKWII